MICGKVKPTNLCTIKTLKLRESQRPVWYKELLIVKTRQSTDIYLCLECWTYISTLPHPPFFPLAFYFFLTRLMSCHCTINFSIHWHLAVSFFFFHCCLPHTHFSYTFSPLLFFLSPSLLSSFIFSGHLLLCSLPVSWHYIMRVWVWLWLHRWNDIMSHNLSFMSQRARAGCCWTHRSLCRHTEQFNNLL